MFNKGKGTNGCTGAMNVLTITDGVQMYLISPEGNVRAPSVDSYFNHAISVIKFDQKEPHGDSLPPAFLIVGNWTYPLLPGRSPVLRSSWGPYIFPDVSPNVITGEYGL